jgi:hypothetical protein
MLQSRWLRTIELMISIINSSGYSCHMDEIPPERTDLSIFDVTSGKPVIGSTYCQRGGLRLA